MAKGSSYGQSERSEEEAKYFPQPRRRATRLLSEEHEKERDLLPVPPSTLRPHQHIVDSEGPPSPLARHHSWLKPFLLSMVVVLIGMLVLLSAGLLQRPGNPQVVTIPGQVYPVQIGGSYDTFNAWENSNGPLPPKQTLPSNPGPYSVLGKPTITVAFINKVLDTYHSPAAGKGQALYDYGVQYGIDPVYGLAFFLHESTFGTAGEARITHSLGNLRCIPTRACSGPNGQGYAIMNSWEDGFLQWYKLIRNLYVAIWNRITIDQIIPKYAPQADHNDEAAYIRSVKHSIDTWHAGLMVVQ
ncbi:MAG: hypothetical protein ABI456_00530, partial [Ktedonobacteraceae bacterium]